MRRNRHAQRALIHSAFCIHTNTQETIGFGQTMSTYVQQQYRNGVSYPNRDTTEHKYILIHAQHITIARKRSTCRHNICSCVCGSRKTHTHTHTHTRTHSRILAHQRPPRENICMRPMYEEKSVRDRERKRRKKHRQESNKEHKMAYSNISDSLVIVAAVVVFVVSMQKKSAAATADTTTI